LVNLVRNAKERLAERGTIRMVFDNSTMDQSFVRIRITTEQSSDADQAWAALTFPIQMESPLGLSLVGAIVTAAEGSICSRLLGENSKEIEILLPRREFNSGRQRASSSSTGKIVLLVGLEAGLASAIRVGLKRRGYVVFDARTIQEALLVANLVGGEIAGLIADGSVASAQQRKLLKARLSDQWVPVLLQLAISPTLMAHGWQTLVKPVGAGEIIDAIEVAFRDLKPKSHAATLP